VHRDGDNGLKRSGKDNPTKGGANTMVEKREESSAEEPADWIYTKYRPTSQLNPRWHISPSHETEGKN